MGITYTPDRLLFSYIFTLALLYRHLFNLLMNKDDKVPAKPTPPSWKIPRWFANIDPQTQQSLKTYWEELIKFNKTVNLVSPKSLIHADAIHFGDSIKASQIVFENNNDIKEISDLGSGNGFPGLVFGMMYPHIRMTLVDVDQRKCEFLKHVIARTGTRNVSVSTSNVERFDEDSLGMAITRGFSSIPKAMMTFRKSMKVGGVIYFLKSEEWSQEVMSLPTQLCSVWSPELVGEYSPPESSAKFFVVKATKTANAAT